MTHLEIARRWMQTYSDGDHEGLLACLADGWTMHERDGSTTSASALAEITRLHAVAFPEKHIDYVQELADGDRVAHYVRFTLVHGGEYLGIQPTGRRLELFEMVFHRFVGARIAESWRMTYPDSTRDALER